jgi:hypothetical protein
MNMKMELTTFQKSLKNALNLSLRHDGLFARIIHTCPHAMVLGCFH